MTQQTTSDAEFNAEEQFVENLKGVFEDLRFSTYAAINAMATLVDLCDAHDKSRLSEEGKRAFGELFCASVDFDDYFVKEEAKAARKKGLRDVLARQARRRDDEPTSH